MKRLLLFIIIIFTYYNLLIGESNILSKNINLKVYISFTQDIFRINDDINLYIEVYNLSDEPVTFKVSHYKLNNIKITVYNLQNGEIMEMRPERLKYDKELKTFKPEQFTLNVKTLYPDEIYKFKINLTEYFDFKKPGKYKIKINFDPFPNIKYPHKVFISNPVTIELKEPLIVETYKKLIQELKEKEEQTLRDPKSTIEFMLNAYMQKDWKNYFLYQNLDTIILKYNQFKNKYLKASPAMKKEIISEFKNWIINRKNREMEEYQIKNVNHSYTEKKAVVECLIKFKKPATFRSFLYKFYLHQQGIKWIVDDLDVIVYYKTK